jgi:hypothetical protein
VSPEAPFEPGFNIKTLIAAIFVGFLMLPGAIYLGLEIGRASCRERVWLKV